MKELLSGLLVEANIQAATPRAYEVKIRNYLNSGFIVMRMDFENYLPDYLVMNDKGQSVLLELKNYRGIETKDNAIKQAKRTEERKLKNKDRQQALDAGIITCVAYNGKFTTIYENRTSGAQIKSPTEYTESVS